MHKHSISPLLQHTDSPYLTVNKTLTLAKHIKASATIQTAKNLKQYIIKMYNESLKSKDTF